MRALLDGRIRRTESEWRAIVGSFESSGLSEAAFCRKARVSRKSFRIWRGRLTASGTSPRVQATRKRRPSPSGFVEWLAPSAPTLLEAKPGSVVAFELVLPGGVFVRWRA